MAEAVSAQMEVARRMIEVEREPLDVDDSPAIEDEATSATDQEEGQLTMFDLFQRHGRQPKKARRRVAKATAAQQLSLFSIGQTASS
jgi:hypothetical protein